MLILASATLASAARDCRRRRRLLTVLAGGLAMVLADTLIGFLIAVALHYLIQALLSHRVVKNA